jgi:hypothetical protein
MTLWDSASAVARPSGAAMRSAQAITVISRFGSNAMKVL